MRSDGARSFPTKFCANFRRVLALLDWSAEFPRTAGNLENSLNSRMCCTRHGTGRRGNAGDVGDVSGLEPRSTPAASLPTVLTL